HGHTKQEAEQDAARDALAKLTGTAPAEVARPARDGRSRRRRAPARVEEPLAEPVAEPEVGGEEPATPKPRRRRSPRRKPAPAAAELTADPAAELVAGWQARIREYPESWARPAVEHHLKVFPIWAAYDQVVARDAQLWTYQMLVEGAQHVLGMLAGLNRVYWASFQFKRAHAFESQLRWKPDRLADRIDSLFTGDTRAATVALEALVAETLDLIDQHIP